MRGNKYVRFSKDWTEKGLVKQKVILYLGSIKRIIEVFNFYKKNPKD